MLRCTTSYQIEYILMMMEQWKVK
uniref:Uncharacterized protein n=1 Tax=Tetranychus urticae TaxID=32264 RepID=T1K7B6_TETUR